MFSNLKSVQCLRVLNIYVDIAILSCLTENSLEFFARFSELKNSKISSDDLNLFDVLKN